MRKEIAVAKVETTLKEWKVQAGERVEPGTVLCTAKLGNITREVSSKESGTITELLFQPGDVIPGAAAACRMEVEEAKAEAGPPAGTEVEVRTGRLGGPATLREWYKEPGSAVKAGEAVAVVSAGKLNKEIAAPCGGELIDVLVEAGAPVPADGILAHIRSDGTGGAQKPQAPKTSVLIIGGGPGGYVAAIRAAQLGASVTLVERGRVGGTCLNVGCIPTKALMHSAEVYQTALHGERCGVTAEGVALQWDRVQQYRQEVSDQLVGGVQGLLAANGVELLEGTASFTGQKQVRIVRTDGSEEERTADKIILATGSEPFMPPIPGVEGNPDCLDSTGALALEKRPESLVIIGGGVIGVELACAYAAFGTAVTVVEMMDRILPAMDYELTQIAQKIMERKGISFFLETRVDGVERGERGPRVLATLKDGQSRAFEAEKVLVAVGRRSRIGTLSAEKGGLAVERGHIAVNDRMETNVPGVYAIGDCVGRVMLAHTASAMGEVAAENALGRSAVYDEHVCPSCVYMFPEFACVGLNEEQVKEKGYAYQTGKFPMAANGKSLIMEETEGWIKILSDKRTGKLLGVHILGARATDLIAEAALAMGMHGGVQDLIHTIHAHPTVAEAVHEAALAVEGRAIHYKE